MKRKRPVPPVMERLFTEHRYLGALLHLLETRSSARTRVKIGDLYLLRDVVAYLHDYPDHVHHPTEDLLFERALQKRPVLQGLVARLRHDHTSLTQETRRLLALLDELIDRPGETRAREALKACRALAQGQRAHMHLENHEAFPAAMAALSSADWQRIETRFLSAEDPLFGNAVSSRHRRLYEYLLDFTDGRERASRLHELMSGLRQRGALLSEGGGDCWARLAELGESIAAVSWSAMGQAMRPASLQAAIALPASYWWQIGRSVSACGADLLRIWATTALRTLSPRALPDDPATPAQAEFALGGSPRARRADPPSPHRG